MYIIISKYSQVSKHNTSDSAWIVINSKVYDVTHYLNKHPGGKE